VVGVKCLACGSTNLVEGALMDTNVAPVYFQLTKKPAWKRMLGIGKREVVTYACVHCGLAQQRVTFTSEDRDQLARFDGPQQSVVDTDP
jgi:hypothetical protein